MYNTGITFVISDTKYIIFDLLLYQFNITIIKYQIIDLLNK